MISQPPAHPEGLWSPSSPSRRGHSSLSPGFLLGRPRPHPTLSAFPSLQRTWTPALFCQMQTWCLCCCCPCCGEVSGPGSWKPVQAGEGLQLQLRPCVPPGSLQEKQGYELRLKESVTVQEGLCVHVPCSFSYPWNLQSSSEVLHIYWYRNGGNIQRNNLVASNNPDKPVRTETANRFRLLEDLRTNSCSLSISNARRSDTGTYFFRVERGHVKYTYTDKKLHLQVTGMAGPRSGPGTWDPRFRTGTGHWNTPCPGLGGVVVERDTGPGVSSGPEA